MVASSGTWGKGQNVTFLLLQLIKKITWMLSWLLGLCICSLAVSFLLWFLSPWLCPCVCLVSLCSLSCVVIISVALHPMFLPILVPHSPLCVSSFCFSSLSVFLHSQCQAYVSESQCGCVTFLLCIYCLFLPLLFVTWSSIFPSSWLACSFRSFLFSSFLFLSVSLVVVTDKWSFLKHRNLYP